MSDKTAPKPTYEVGYGKPPKHSQFKPGQWGIQKADAKACRTSAPM